MWPDSKKKKEKRTAWLTTPDNDYIRGETGRVTYLHHIDDVVRQPENAERQHNGQDEFLAADAATEPGLSDAS